MDILCATSPQIDCWLCTWRRKKESKICKETGSLDVWVGTNGAIIVFDIAQNGELYSDVTGECYVLT